ncbi:unnamed protein product [Penicillium olsonii]|nr:unnamed protein product [Penicillium olsonii]CAG7928833.1 unnamed protein product [Penicillium olsonii]
MVPDIPADFLRGPAQHATLHKLDFEQTTPPIPAFKNHFAAVVEDLLTESECKELLRLGEDSTRTELPDSTLSAPKWERATINAGNNRQIMSVDSRKSGRVIFDSAEVAARLFDRILPFLRECDIEVIKNRPLVTGLGPAKRGEELRLSRLNERLRFLRYEGGDYFRPHWDGCYVTPDGKEKSLFTIHLYLNGEGDQDMDELRPHIERAEKQNWLFQKNGEIDLSEVGFEEAGDSSALEAHDENDTLLGGATSFSDGMTSKEAVRIFPKTGSVLIFQQRNLFHCGDDVFRGVKYTVRTDVLYTTE